MSTWFRVSDTDETYLEVPHDVRTGSKSGTDHTDKVHTPDGDGGEACSRGEQEDIVAPSS